MAKTLRRSVTNPVGDRFKSIETDDPKKQKEDVNRNSSNEDRIHNYDPNHEINIEWEGKEYYAEVKDFKTKNLTMLEVKEALNEVSARYAFWASLAVDVATEINRLTNEFNEWYAPKYADEKAAEPKATETALKNSIYLTYATYVSDYHNKLNALEKIKGKIKVIVDSYDMQSWSLRSIANIINQEIAFHATGGGNLPVK